MPYRKTASTQVDLGLSIKEVENIVSFLGYGNPRRSVWFVGIEEGLGGADSADALYNLRARATFSRVMGLRDAHHQNLRENGALIDFDANPPSTPVWQWMAKIMRFLEGKADWADIGRAKEYIRRCLGRTDGNTFLTELSPIPSNTTANRDWLRAFTELNADLNKKLVNRREQLLKLLNESNPRMVICYGDGKVRAGCYSTFLSAEWTPRSARIKHSDSNRVYPLLLLPFFGNGRMSHAVIEEMLDFRDPTAAMASNCL